MHIGVVPAFALVHAHICDEANQILAVSTMWNDFARVYQSARYLCLIRLVLNDVCMD